MSHLRCALLIVFNVRLKFGFGSARSSRLFCAGTRPNMSEDGARQRKPDKEEAPSSSKEPEEEPLSFEKKAENLYHKFVESFENALNAVVTGDGHLGPTPRIKSKTIEGIAEYIKKEKPTNVIVMSGAGISTSAGIPDFRTPGSGLYDNLQQYNLSDPQDIFDLRFFKKNPEPFFMLAKGLFPKEIKPTACHHFVYLLYKKGLLRRWFTQNIDSLEFLTGIEPNKVVAAHGSHRTSTCLKCGHKYDLQWITEFLDDKDKKVAKCDRDGCKGLVKPDIVFFGENLPRRFFECALSDFPKCDLLIILGTSLVVQPFAGLIAEVAEDTPRFLINLEPVAQITPSEKVAGITGLCYADHTDKRDIFWKGTCDDGCRRLAQLLGWEEELEILVEQGCPTAALR